MRCSYHDFSKSAFIPLNVALVRLHVKYGIPACLPNLVADINRLGRIQRSATRLVTGIRHLPYEEKLKRLSLHSLQKRRLRSNLITAFKIFMGLLDMNSNLFFLPPTRRGLRRYPKVRATADGESQLTAVRFCRLPPVSTSYQDGFWEGSQWMPRG